jgi:hypothetical protein
MKGGRGEDLKERMMRKIRKKADGKNWGMKEEEKVLNKRGGEELRERRKRKIRKKLDGKN